MEGHSKQRRGEDKEADDLVFPLLAEANIIPSVKALTIRSEATGVREVAGWEDGGINRMIWLH